MAEDIVELPRALELVEPSDIAELTDVNEAAARDVLDALHTIERAERPWRDPEVLRRLYYEEGLGQEVIADRLGCGQKTVARNMDRLDLAPGRGATAKGARTLVAMDPDDVQDPASAEGGRDERVAATRTDGGADGRE